MTAQTAAPTRNNRAACARDGRSEVVARYAPHLRGHLRNRARRASACFACHGIPESWRACRAWRDFARGGSERRRPLRLACDAPLPPEMPSLRMRARRRHAVPRRLGRRADRHARVPRDRAYHPVHRLVCRVPCGAQEARYQGLAAFGRRQCAGRADVRMSVRISRFRAVRASRCESLPETGKSGGASSVL